MKLFYLFCWRCAALAGLARRPSAAEVTLGILVKLIALSNGGDTGKIEFLITFYQGSCLTLGSGNSEINGFGGHLRIFN